jgi:uncharacterized membrane protein YfcA
MGGGIIIVPMLVLLFHVEMHYAAGASLVAVIATSSGAAAAYLSEGYTNLRVGMFLQLPCIAGGVCGALLAAILPVPLLFTVFGFVLLFSGYLSFRRKEEAERERPSDRLAVRLRLESSYPTVSGWRAYKVYRVLPSFVLMGVAGLLSGLLGIGSGAVNVLSMDQIMRLPYKVSTTTSNFMVGITAAASAGVYLNNGFIDPGLTMPIMLGVFGGSVAGARILMFVNPRPLRILFSAVVLLMAVEMIYKGVTR